MSFSRLLTMTTLACALTGPALADRVSVLVFDASGSMWNRVEGDLTRIEVARDVMGDYFATRDGAVPLSVIAYGHNRRGDCGDIEVIAPMGQTAPGDLERRLRALMPRGMTPLTDSLAMARDQIPPTAEAADIILVTDGLETCEGDPCALAARLAAEGIDIRAHVVGFGLTRVEVEALSCITEQTGGMLFETNSGAELAEALQQVSAAPPPPPAPEPEPETPAPLAQHFVFRDMGTGTPRGLMEWRAEGPDGTVIPLGTTEGTQQSLAGLSTELPAGDWLIVAEGAEGRAERQMSLTQCCGHHGIPFTGTEMVARIPPLGQVQAGMAARLPYEITHPGTSNLGGTPYKIIATGPEGSLTRDQVLVDDLITSREPGLRGGATGQLAPGTYRLVIAIIRSGRFDIIAERSFEVVENPQITIVGPDRALPGERIELSLGGGYATGYDFGVVDDGDRTIGRTTALYQGAGGRLTVTLQMPDREGVFDLVIRPSGHPRDRETILARRPITISATAEPAPVQDALAPVPATFRMPPEAPDYPVTWSATPLDPDMTPDSWEPRRGDRVLTDTFEPGRWLMRAQMPNQYDFSATVEIFPGQPNDFMMDMHPTSLDGALEGPWTVWAIPPRGISDPPMRMMEIDLRLTHERQDYIGTFATTTAMGGQVLTGDLTSVTGDDEYLYFTVPLPQITPEPFTLALGPQGVGFIGTMTTGGNTLPVALWPTGVAEDPALWQSAAYPPGNNYVPEFAFTCTEPRCEVVIERLSVTLEQGWSMTEPSWISATAGAHPMSAPSAMFHGPDDAMLMLNPHQWLDSNGPCIGTDAGGLCLWRDGPPAAAAAAVPLSMSLRIVEEQAQTQPGRNDFRGLAFELPGVPLDAQVSLQMRLTEGEDAMDGVIYTNAVQQMRQPYRIGNRYDINAEYQGRDYVARNVEIVVGTDAQVVRLSPVVFSYEFEVSADPPPAGTPGFFGVDVTAPEGFDGSFALHPEWERDGAPLFAVGAAEWLGAQDQVLPVPAQPGTYELRYLDASGAMIGAALIDVPNAEGQGSMAIEPDDGTRFGNYGPYLAGAEVLVQVRRGDDMRTGDQVVVLRTGSDRALPDTGEWIDDFRVRIRMPDTPGDYTLALFDTDASSLRALSPAPVEAAPVPSFWNYNANPVPGRAFGVVAVGRMALSDRMAIVTPAGAVVTEAPLLEAMTGRMRLPENLSGPHELRYIADGQVLARAALDVDGPSPLMPSGGSDGPAEISMEGAMVPGGSVQVSLRGMIPAQSIVGFLRPGAPSRTIFQTSSRASPENPVVMLNVPPGAGPWVLRLTDHNLTQITEMVPGAATAGNGATNPPPGGAGLVPMAPRGGITTQELINTLLPALSTE